MSLADRLRNLTTEDLNRDLAEVLGVRNELNFNKDTVTVDGETVSLGELILAAESVTPPPRTVEISDL